MIITKAHNGHLHASHAWANTHGRDRIYTFYIHSTIVMWPLSVKFSKPPLKKDILISLSPDDATPPWFLQAFYYSPCDSYSVRRLHNVGIPESLDDNPIKNWTLNLSFLFGQLVIHNHCCLDEYSLILRKFNFWFVVVPLRGCSVLDCILPRNQSWLFASYNNKSILIVCAS